MTWLDGVVTHPADASLTLAIGDARPRIGAGFAREPAPGSAITLGFRPRAIRPGRGEGLVFNGAIVTLAENIWADTLVHAD